MRNTCVELRLVVTLVLLVDETELFEGFLVLGGLEANPAKLENRRDVLAPGLFGILFDRAIEEPDASVAVAGERAFDEILERAYRSLRRVSCQLIARERQSLVVLIEYLVCQIALKLLQINERASAIVFFADQPALSYINNPSGDRDRAVTSFTGDAVGAHHNQVGSGALGDLDHRGPSEYCRRRQALLLKGDVALVGSDRDQPGLVEQIGQSRGKALANPVVFGTAG